MSGGATLEYVANDEDATQKLGVALAISVHAGDLILLQGTLGTGKSVLARATIRALLAQPDVEVPSPTFLLVLPYEGPSFPILHSDLYRVNRPQEIEELGLFENPHSLVLLEWPERAPELFTQADLMISIDMVKANGARKISISSPTNSRSYQTLCRSPLFLA